MTKRPQSSLPPSSNVAVAAVAQVQPPGDAESATNAWLTDWENGP